MVGISDFLTELQVQAGALDVALHQGWTQLNTLIQILQSLNGVATQVCEGSTHVKGKSLKVIQTTNLKSLLERGSGLLVSVTSLLGHSDQTLAQQTLARILAQLNILIQTLGQGLRAEALQVVGDKGSAGKLLAASLQDGLALLLGNLLQKALQGVTADVVGESIDDAAGGEVEEGVAVLLEVLVGNGATVQGLDVFAVHGKGGAGVLNNLLPVGLDIVTSGAVGIEDGVGLADDGLAVQLDGSGVVLDTVGLVTGSLQLGGVFLAGLAVTVSEGAPMASRNWTINKNSPPQRAHRWWPRPPRAIPRARRPSSQALIYDVSYRATVV